MPVAAGYDLRLALTQGNILNPGHLAAKLGPDGITTGTKASFFNLGDTVTDQDLLVRFSRPERLQLSERPACRAPYAAMARRCRSCAKPLVPSRK
jgi:hypothetical protein